MKLIIQKSFLEQAWVIQEIAYNMSKLKNVNFRGKTLISNKSYID